MIWYEKYDFTSNPLSIKPQEGYDDFFGQKEILKKINSNIKKNNFSIVVGSFGTGKTTIMKGIIDRNRGQKKLAYYNSYGTEKAINFDNLLTSAGSFFSRFFGIKSKDVILILDEAHHLMKRDFENVLYYYNEGNLKSVIFVTSEKKFNFPEEIMAKVGENVFELSDLSEDDAVKLINARMEGVDLLSKDIIKKILSKSKNPREFLMNCEKSCRNAVERDSEKVEEEDLPTD